MNVPDHDVPIRVDHVGVAVFDIAEAEPVLFALGCEKLIEDTVDGRYTWANYRLGDASRIELVEPVSEGTFLTDFLEKHGRGLHHVTLEVADVDAMVKHLEEAGVEVVDYAEFEGWTEAFVSPRNPTGVLFQLMEYHDKYTAERWTRDQLFVGGLPVEETDDTG